MSTKTSPENGSNIQTSCPSTEVKDGGKTLEPDKLVVVGKEDTGLLKLTTAIFYAVSSFLIMVVNKQVLTVHGFPSFQVRLEIGSKHVVPCLLGNVDI